MPTRTEHIPCPTCGVPRPIVVRMPVDQVRARKRRCRECADTARIKPKRQYPVELIPCIQCGVERPIIIYHQQARDRAATHTCHPCAQRNKGGQLQHVDEVAVHRLINGSPVNATPAERFAAIAYLTGKKFSARVIAERLRCTTRTVERHRARLAAA